MWLAARYDPERYPYIDKRSFMFANSTFDGNTFSYISSLPKENYF